MKFFLDIAALSVGFFMSLVMLSIPVGLVFLMLMYWG